MWLNKRGTDRTINFISGLQHVESTVTALVDIIHAFAIADPSKVGLAVKQYVKMLLCEVHVFTSLLLHVNINNVKNGLSFRIIQLHLCTTDSEET